MQIEEFTELLKKPYSIKETQLNDLNAIVNRYPYFQSASLLYTKALDQFKSINYQTELRKSALLALNRKVLYKLIALRAPLENVQQESSLNENIKKEESGKQNENGELDLPHNEISILENIPFVSNSIPQTDNYFSSNLITEETNEKAEIDEQIKITERSEEINTEDKLSKNKHPEWTEQPERTEDVFAKEVINAYVEKEILKVTDMNTPVPLSQDYSKERHDFAGWLKAMHTQQGVPKVSGDKKQDKQQEHKQSIIDKFIKDEPKIGKPVSDKTFFKATSFARESLIEDETIVTETLARIYWAQGNLSKAVRAYEVLGLKYPEKSSYFASLIKEIKSKSK